MTSDDAAREAEHSKAVREMFAGIAGKYDFLNHFLSLNIDRRWRRAVRRELEPILSRRDAVILDVACGTGDLSLELASGSNATVLGTDFCRPMLAIAATKSREAKIPFVEADAMSLPFPNETFDAVTIAFGLRNLPNWEKGIAELARVLKAAGRLVVLEFSSPAVPGLRRIFNFYFTRILPRIGGAVSGSRGAYEYLPDSVSRFPDQRGLAEMMQRGGLANVEYRNLSGGIAAIHTGSKPPKF
jgi:demethylmenaquinone methyltransferase/2-methoxy-6-polyprenyl-1,4-benzoquinol methylase